jgi:hypothetical protein
MACPLLDKALQHAGTDLWKLEKLLVSCWISVLVSAQQVVLTRAGGCGSTSGCLAHWPRCPSSGEEAHMPPIKRRVYAVSILAAFLVSCCFPIFLSAQNLGDDVHINPRPQPVVAAPPSPVVDAALKTHSKPI